MTILRSLRSQRGAVSWSVVGVIAVMVLTLGLAVSQLADSETFQSVIHRSKNDVYFVADSGRRVAERCFQLYMLGSVKQNIPADVTATDFSAIVAAGDPVKFLEYGGIPNASLGVAQYRVNLGGGTATSNLVKDPGAPIENTIGPGRSFDATIEVLKNDAPYQTADYWAFPLRFKINVVATAPTMRGQVSHETITGRGTVTLYVNKRSFANYVEYTREYTSMHGEPTMKGRDAYYGPVHTGGKFKFMDSPGTYYKSEVTTTSSTAYFWSGSAWAEDAGQFYPPNAKKTYLVKPQFNGGYFQNVVVTDLPSSFAFFRIMTLGSNIIEPPLTAPSNIYTAAEDLLMTMRSGGIYVSGDCDIVLQNSLGNQIYTFTHYDSSGGVVGTSTITLDYVNNQTIIQRVGDTAPKTYAGLIDVDSKKAGPQGSIYVRGAVKSIKGSLARDTQLSILSTGTMTITGDITYAASPVTDPTAANILGLISENSDVTIAYPVAPTDIIIQAHIMTPKGEFWCSQNAGSLKGKVNLFGSVASQRAGVMGSQTTGYAKNYTWDTRATFAPPPLYPQQSKYGIILERPESGNSTWRVVWANESMP